MNKPNKGEKGGECNRTACNNPNASWFNTATNKFYCPKCGRAINEHNSPPPCIMPSEERERMKPEDMTMEEATDEFHRLDRYFQSCKEIGQGIGSKESVRFLLCADRINSLDPLAEVWSEYHYAGPATLVVARKTQLDAIKRLRSQTPAGA